MSNNSNQPEMELNEIIRVRHDKLKELKDEGRDPFVITKFDFKRYFRRLYHRGAHNRGARRKEKCNRTYFAS